jgi:hypothetical protein
MRTVVLAASIVVLTSLAGCGGSSGGSAQSVDVPPPPDTAPVLTPSTASTPTSDSPALSPWFVVHLSFPDAYTGTATVTAGELSSYSDAQAFPTIPLGESCETDAETTAVVPVDVELTNTTASFSSRIEVPITLSDGVQFEEGFSDGPTCESGPFSLGAELAPGASSDTYGYLFISDYYSPDAPDGQSSLTRGLLSTTTYATDSGTDDVVRRVTGTGVGRDYSSFGYPWTLSLPSSDL